MTHRTYEPKYAQADKVIARHGGITAMADMYGLSRSTIQYWNWPARRHKNGCDGLIPTRTLIRIRDQARLHGVFLTDDDLAVTINPNWQKQPETRYDADHRN